MKLSNMQNDDKKLWFRRLWIVLIAFLGYQMTSYAIRSLSVPRQVRKIVAAYPEQQKAIAAEAEKEAEPKKDDKEKPKGDLFTPPPGKPPMPKCTAILGDSALINDQWVKVDAEVNGAKIVEIFPNYVMVTRDGQEHKLVPFEIDVQYNGGGQASPTPAPNGPGKGPDEVAVSPQQQAEATERPGRQRGDRGRRQGRPNGTMNMTAEQRELYERYQNASPEEQARMREEYRQRQGG